MRQRAWVYIYAVLICGMGLALYGLSVPPSGSSELAPYILLSLLAILTEYVKGNTAPHITYSATTAIHFTGLLLLGPFFFVLLVLPPMGLDWLYRWARRDPLLRDWYKQAFNMAMLLIIGFVAMGVGRLAPAGRLDPSDHSTSMIFTVLAAAALYHLLNEVLLAIVLVLAQTVPLRVVMQRNLSQWVMDMLLLPLGYMAAILWTLNPLYFLVVTSPLILAYRAMSIPRLEEKAQMDSKTGLLNAQHLMKRAEVEWVQSRIMDRPLTVLLADLDLLRNINNTYGHLAGDTVIIGISDIIRRTLRDRDIAGRFGGEEFAIVLPGIGREGAYLIAERLRHAVESAVFPVVTSPHPIRATLSVGLASFPEDGRTLKQLLHQADLAVYMAKAQGRNRVVCSADVPEDFSLQADFPLAAIS